MDQVASDYSADQEIHVITDNYRVHKRRDLCLVERSNFKFHFAPASSNWLNMVEIWFGIMTRKTLKGSGFKDYSELAQAIKDFILARDDNAEPFVWRKRDAKGRASLGILS
jgi:transposase